MNESQTKPTEQQPPSAAKTDSGSKSPAKKGCLGCLGIIVLVAIIVAAVSGSSGGPNGNWVKDKNLPRGYDSIAVKVDGSIVVAIIQIGPATIGHSGQISTKKEEDGGKKITILATVKADSQGVKGLEGRVLNDALDVMLTYRKGENSKEDRLDYFVTGHSGGVQTAEPVLLEGLHRSE